MLPYETAKNLYEEIKEKISGNTNELLNEMYKDFLKNATDYAKTRTDWSFMGRTDRIAEDKKRTIKHNAFISSLNPICRNLGIDGTDEIMPDRKTKGDFACYIALFLALEQR